MRVRSQACEQGVRLFVGRDTDLGVHGNVLAYLQRGGERPKPQEQEAESADLPATPDSNATTLVLPGLRSEQEDEAGSPVSKVSVSSDGAAPGSPAIKRASEVSLPATPAVKRARDMPTPRAPKKQRQKEVLSPGTPVPDGQSKDSTPGVLAPKKQLFLTQLEQKLHLGLTSPRSSLREEDRVLVAKLQQDVQAALAPARLQENEKSSPGTGSTEAPC